MIACIGETLEQREPGSTMAVVAAQAKAIAGTFYRNVKEAKPIVCFVSYIGFNR